MGKAQVKVGFCIAYDWDLLHHSLPLVYKSADLICLALDKNRISWSGQKFEFGEHQFYSFVKNIDPEKKIKILEEEYYDPQLTPMENEVRQRNMMAAFMRIGGWHIQLDCDEYFTKFESFVKFLKTQNPNSKATNYCCSLITLFKKTRNGFLIIDSQTKGGMETIAIASNAPKYQFGRRNGYFNHHSQFQIVHQSWARTELEVLQKISNWGHKNDFDPIRFLDFWRSLDEENFRVAKNFHPIDPAAWPSLKFIEAKSIEELTRHPDLSQLVNFTSWDLLLKNSRVISKMKSLLR
jgi:hypothetical protein